MCSDEQAKKARTSIYHRGARAVASYLFTNYKIEAIHGANDTGLVVAEKMSSSRTAAMCTDAGLPLKKSRIIAQHLKEHFQTAVMAPEKKWMELGDEYSIPRRYGEHKYVHVNKKDGDDKGKRTPKTAQYWVSDVFAATKSELAWRAKEGRIIKGLDFPGMKTRARTRLDLLIRIGPTYRFPWVSVGSLPSVV